MSIRSLGKILVLCGVFSAAYAGSEVLIAAAPVVWDKSGKPGYDANVIYGKDNRKDLYQIKNSQMLQLADSTVALFPASNVSIDPAKGIASLATTPYGPAFGLCKEEPFYDQSEGANCSGFLVGHDLIATAGHCINDMDQCANTKFVFGFGIREKGQNPNQVPAGDVYGCKEIVGRQQNGNGPDWEVVRLDHAVPNHKPLELDRGQHIKQGTPLFVIGHPSGLPTKIADGAWVRQVTSDGYFLANLDTYHGNSGSAVFNSNTGLVEGILVRGEDDYVLNESGSCQISKVCTDDGCSGEGVTEIAYAAPNIPIGGNLMYAMKSMRPGLAMTSLLDNAGEGAEVLTLSR